MCLFSLFSSTKAEDLHKCQPTIIDQKQWLFCPTPYWLV